MSARLISYVTWKFLLLDRYITEIAVDRGTALVVDRNNRVVVHGTLPCHLTFWAFLNDSACTFLVSYSYYKKWW